MKNMKNIIAILLTLMMAVGMVACGSNVEPTEAPTEPNIVETVAPTEPATAPPTEAPTEPPIVVPELSTEWTDYQFAIGENVFTLPVAYSDLKEATGFTIGENAEAGVVAPNFSMSVIARDQNGDHAGLIFLMNDTDTDLTCAECKVVGVNQNEAMHKPLGEKVYVANGLGIGAIATKDSLTEMFGEPVETREVKIGEDTFELYTWSENAENLSNNFLTIGVRVDTNEIMYVAMDNCTFDVE